MTDPQLLPAPTQRSDGPTRRGVLRAVGVSGAAAALLAACGGGGDAATGDPAGSETATPGSESSDGGESSGAAAGGALIATADVPVGSGVILEAEKVVVTQPKAGKFKAFTAVCTHQSCTVASVKADRISCACHGSAFSAKDGSVLGGPATRPLKEIAVSVEGDQVVEA